MIDKETCGAIFEKYHKNVYNFCCKYLNDPLAAEDCTEEVFYTLLKKKDKIDLTENLLSWLLETARRICKNYLSQNSVVMLNIDEMEDELADDTYITDKPLSEEIYDFLDKEDADILINYLNADYGERRNIAKNLGVVPNTLSKRIMRIKKKISDHFSK